MEVEKCDLGFVHCGHPAVAACSVCGRYFCAIHGTEEKGVCRSCFSASLARDAAETIKAEDMAAREEAAARNDQKFCGARGCHSTVLTQYCQRCANWFCGNHIRRYSYRITVQTVTGSTTMQQEIALCNHCAPHLRDYEKEQF